MMFTESWSLPSLINRNCCQLCSVSVLLISWTATPSSWWKLTSQFYSMLSPETGEEKSCLSTPAFYSYMSPRCMSHSVDSGSEAYVCSSTRLLCVPVWQVWTTWFPQEEVNQMPHVQKPQESRQAWRFLNFLKCFQSEHQGWQRRLCCFVHCWQNLRGARGGNLQHSVVEHRLLSANFTEGDERSPDSQGGTVDGDVCVSMLWWGAESCTTFFLSSLWRCSRLSHSTLLVHVWALLPQGAVWSGSSHNLGLILGPKQPRGPGFVIGWNLTSCFCFTPRGRASGRGNSFGLKVRPKFLLQSDPPPPWARQCSG